MNKTELHLMHILNVIESWWSCIKHDVKYMYKNVHAQWFEHTG